MLADTQIDRLPCNLMFSYFCPERQGAGVPPAYVGPRAFQEVLAGSTHMRQLVDEAECA